MQFDLIVVGGGINGAGIARDAALRGLAHLPPRAGRPLQQHHALVQPADPRRAPLPGVRRARPGARVPAGAGEPAAQRAAPGPPAAADDSRLRERPAWHEHGGLRPLRLRPALHRPLRAGPSPPVPGRGAGGDAGTAGRRPDRCRRLLRRPGHLRGAARGGERARRRGGRRPHRDPHGRRESAARTQPRDRRRGARHTDGRAFHPARQGHHQRRGSLGGPDPRGRRPAPAALPGTDQGHAHRRAGRSRA